MRERSVICPKKMKRLGIVTVRSQGKVWRGWALYPGGAELNTVSCLLSRSCAVISTLPFVFSVFIHRCTRVDNQSNLPPRRETGLCSCLQDACLSPSDLRNTQSWRADTREGLTLVSLSHVASASEHTLA